MAGNVVEWTLDWYANSFYGTAAATLKDPANLTIATDRVGRGGSFGDNAAVLRSSVRWVATPSNYGKNLGMRCAKSATPCPAGTKQCNGLNLQVCKADGSGWDSVACDDGNACTTGACAPATGCTHAPVAVGTACGANGQCDGIGTCAIQNAVGCGLDGTACGNGKGACSKGHCFSTDAKGYKWTLVPAGTFWMGCNATVTNGCPANEMPLHQIDMSAYWIGVYEVTVANYKGCVDSKWPGCTPPVGTTYANWAVPGREQHPVNYVSFFQSQGYCKWLGGDLPTEAQWEKAAMGGCELYGSACAAYDPLFPWGKAAPICGQQAVFSNMPSKTCGGAVTTYAVGTGSASGQSPYGAYDMAGNVWEKTLDWYDTAFYGKPAASQKDAVNSTTATSRIIRGGSFSTDINQLYAGLRNPTPAVGSWFDAGARCVKPVQ